MKILIRVILVVVLLVVLLVVFLPSIISSGGMRALVMEQANRSMPGSLEIDRWSLGWLGGVKMKGVRYQDPAGTELLNVAGITIHRGLLGLAANYQEIGRVSIDQPVVRIPLKSTSPAPATPATAPGKRSPSKQPSARPAAPPGPVSIPNLRLELVVEGGQVLLEQDHGESTPVVNDLKLDVVMNGVSEPARLLLGFRSGGGTVKLDGSADLGGQTELDPKAVEVDTRLTLDAIRLDDLTRLVSGMADLPTADGEVNGRIQLKGSLRTGLTLEGTVKAAALRLGGDLLKGDAPDLGDVELTVDGALAAEKVTLTSLALKSGLATVSANGTAGSTTDGEFAAKAAVNIAELLRQFPRTVGLQEGVSVSSGSLQATATVRRTGGVNDLDAALVLSPLTGAKDGAELAWEHPTEVRLAGSQGPRTFRVDRFQLESPFLNGRGSGDLNGMELTLEADAGRAVQEIRKLVDLGPWNGSGQFQLVARVASVADDIRSVTARLVATGVSLQANDQDLIPSSPITLQTQALVENLGSGKPISIRDVQAIWNLWLIQGKAAVDEVRMPDPQTASPGALPRVIEATLAGEGDLGKWVGLLHGLKLVDPEMSLAGRATINARASVTEQTVNLDGFSATLSDLTYRQGEQSLSDPQVALSAKGSYSVDSGAATVSSANAAFASGRLQVTQASFAPGPNGGEPQVRAAVEGALDLQKLSAQAASIIALPEGMTLEGTTRLSLNVDTAQPGRQTAQLQANAQGLTVTSRNGTGVRDQQLSLTADVVRDPASGRVDLDPLDLQSEPVTVSAMTRFSPAGQAGELDLRGDLALDLASISRYVNAFAGTSLVMKGKDKKPFFLTSRWSGQEGENVLAQSEFAAGLAAEQIEAFGFQIGQLEVPVTLSDGIGRARVEAAVNQGRLAVYPLVDLRAASPQLVLDQPTNVLTNIQITPAIANDLLALVHPLFRGATGARGTMSMGFSQFVWPLDAKRQNEAQFAGALDFRDLTLASSGLWYALMEAAKIKEREMTLGDRRVEFLCENGRISTSPIRIKVEDSEFVLSGSMGLDQTLDYVAQIPVTKELVGSEAFPYLEGTSLRIPITGPASKPNLGLHVIQKAISDLAGQAIRKQVEKKAGQLIESLFR